MISVVNGFLCTCSCDVAKAKRGVDPHPKSDDPAKDVEALAKGAAAKAKGTNSIAGDTAEVSATGPLTNGTVVTATTAAQVSNQVSGDGRGQIFDLLI
jgi:hypothetical protein